MNATTRKFGYPETCLWQGASWVMLLRPQQVTLGALVLANTSEATGFATVPSAAMTEYGLALQHAERALQSFRPFDKINYLTLMMVDPHVHTHIIPRYAAPQHYHGVAFIDAGWPATPDLKSVKAIPETVVGHLIGDLIRHFEQTAAHAQHA